MELNFNLLNESPVENGTNMLEFEHKISLDSIIKVIGVGGGGCNAVNQMQIQGIDGVDFIVCNTDIKALNTSVVQNKIALGNLGLGAGSKAEKARAMAEKQADEIRSVIENKTKMLFIAAGMGGGTGTGAAPVIARIAKEIHPADMDPGEILVVGVVNTPFGWEGPVRKRQAQSGIEELRGIVDAMIVINNDNLRSMGGNMTIPESFRQANNVLFSAVKGIADLITGAGIVNLDFQDVNTVMEHSGRALMGIGNGRGDNRALDAIKAASTSSLLDDSDITGAQNLLLYFFFSQGNELTNDEMEEITNYVRSITRNNDTNIIWGMSYDDTIADDELRITLIATCLNHQASTPAPAEEKKTVEEKIENKESSINEPVSTREKELTKTVPEELQPRVRTADEPADETAKEAPITRIGLYDDPKQPEKEKEVDSELATTVDNGIAVDFGDLFQTVDESISTPQLEQTTDKVETVEVTAKRPVYTPPIISKPHTTNPAKDSQTDEINLGTIADRSKRMHAFYEMLHNDPNGPKKLEEMSTEELMGRLPFQAVPASQSEVSNSHVSRSGAIETGNTYLYNTTD